MTCVTECYAERTTETDSLLIQSWIQCSWSISPASSRGSQDNWPWSTRERLRLRKKPDYMDQELSTNIWDLYIKSASWSQIPRKWSKWRTYSNWCQGSQHGRKNVFKHFTRDEKALLISTTSPTCVNIKRDFDRLFTSSRKHIFIIRQTKKASLDESHPSSKMELRRESFNNEHFFFTNIFFYRE